jgi:hypothetical protein
LLESVPLKEKPLTLTVLPLPMQIAGAASPLTYALEAETNTGYSPIYSNCAISCDQVLRAISKDGSLFSPAYLAQFDVVFFYSCGDLFSTGTDGQPAMMWVAQNGWSREFSVAKRGDTEVLVTSWTDPARAATGGVADASAALGRRQTENLEAVSGTSTMATPKSA